MADPHLDFLAEYKSELGELTFNSKAVINNLTMLASENITAAAGISAAIEGHIITCSPKHGLNALYLLDSIVKNVGEPYTSLFARNLPEVVSRVLSADSSCLPTLQKLLQFWEGVFAQVTIEAVRRRLLASGPTSKPAPAQAPQPARDPRRAPGHPRHSPRTMQPLVAGAQTQLPVQYPLGPGIAPLVGRSPGYVPAAAAFAPSVPSPGHLPAMYQATIPSPGHALPQPAYQVPSLSPGHQHTAAPLPHAQPVYGAAPGIYPPQSPPPPVLHAAGGGPAAYSSSGQAGTWGPAAQSSNLPSLGGLGQTPPTAAAGLTGAVALPDFLSSLMDAGLIHMPGAAPRLPPAPAQLAALKLPLTQVNRSKLNFEPSRLKVTDREVVEELRAASAVHRAANLDRVYKARRQQRTQARASQPWFVPLEAWLAGASADASAAPQFFQDGAAPEKEAPAEAPSVPADDTQAVCAVSGERFDTVWDAQREEWRFANAVRIDAAQAARLGVAEGCIVKASVLATSPEAPAGPLDAPGVASAPETDQAQGQTSALADASAAADSTPADAVKPPAAADAAAASELVPAVPAVPPHVKLEPGTEGVPGTASLGRPMVKPDPDAGAAEGITQLGAKLVTMPCKREADELLGANGAGASKRGRPA